MKSYLKIAAIAGALMLGGCGGGDEQGAGGLTAEENRKLDNIAETLDASADSLVANDVAPGNDIWEQAESGNVVVDANATVANEQ